MAEAKTLAEALVAFQADAPKIALDAENPHFRSKFPSLAGVMDTVRPALAKQSLGLMQLPSVVEGQPALTTRLVHGPSGESVESTMLLLPAKSDPQGQGSALTYARRYAVLGLLGLVGDEDDDGNAASAPAAKVEKSKPKFTAPAQAKPDEEAVKLATQLLELVGQIGDGNGTKAELVPATQALIRQHAGDKPWLLRQIAAAKKNLETASPIPF